MMRIALTLIAMTTGCLLSCGPPPPPSSAPSISAAPAAEPEPEPQPEPKFVQPEVEPGENGWEIYTTQTSVSMQGAKGVAPGNDTPEAAVIHFYASLMREDDRYEEVLIPERSEKLKKKLEKVKSWTFWNVRLERRKPSGEGSYWIKIHYRLEVAKLVASEPVFEEGTDDVEVTQVDGKWYVSSIPT